MRAQLDNISQSKLFALIKKAGKCHVSSTNKVKVEVLVLSAAHFTRIYRGPGRMLI